MRAQSRRLYLPWLAALLALGTTAWAEPPPDALVAEIPFHPDAPPEDVALDLALDGQQPFVLVLDTGASSSVLTTGTARALGVSIRRTKNAPYRKATRLGRDLQFWIDDRFSDTAVKSFEYGLLGGDFLDDYVLEIDYPGRMVRFYDPRRFEVPEKAQAVDEGVIPFRRSGTRILVDLEIDGKTVLTLLDTGAPAVVIAGREARKSGIDWMGLPQLDGVRGVLGPIEIYTYEAEQLRLGGFAIGNQPISIAPKGSYNQGGPTDSALGYDVLKRFVLRIDYENKRIWLKSGGDTSPTYWGGQLARKQAVEDGAE